MKIIAAFMVILLSFCPIVTSKETTAPSHRLITEAASAGRKQVETTETIIAADVPVESETGKEDEVISQSPAHEHTWIAVTETVHHDPVYQVIHHEVQTENVWVEDKPAYDETYENTYLVGMHDICKGCGMDITASGMSFEEYAAHDRQHILNGEDSSYYSQAIFETRIETIHHEAEGHYEEIVAREAYDETVLVSEAWDEEIIIGYVCEECGEVQ